VLTDYGTTSASATFAFFFPSSSFSGPLLVGMSEANPVRSHLLDPSLPKRRGRPPKAVVAARTAMLAAAQAKAQAQAFKKQQLALESSSSSSSEDDIDDLTLITGSDRICRTKLGFDFDPFSSDDDPFRSIPSTSQLLIHHDDTSPTPSPHKLSWEDSPITYPDDDYHQYEDTSAALVTKSDLDDDQDQSTPMDLEEVLHSALLAENDTQNDTQVPHNLKKWDIIPLTSFRWTRESMDLPTFSPRRHATKSLQKRIIMSAGSYYPSYPAHPHHHLHYRQPHSIPHPPKQISKTRPLPPPLLVLPTSKFRGPGMYPGIVKTRPDNHHP